MMMDDWNEGTRRPETLSPLASTETDEGRRSWAEGDEKGGIALMYYACTEQGQVLVRPARGIWSLIY